ATAMADETTKTATSPPSPSGGPSGTGQGSPPSLLTVTVPPWVATPGVKVRPHWQAPRRTAAESSAPPRRTRRVGEVGIEGSPAVSGTSRGASTAPARTRFAVRRFDATAPWPAGRPPGPRAILGPAVDGRSPGRGRHAAGGGTFAA